MPNWGQPIGEGRNVSGINTVQVPTRKIIGMCLAEGLKPIKNIRESLIFFIYLE
jgi:hypothetical protein